MSQSRKLVIVAAVALLVGGLVGFFAGRALLERKWSQPYAALSPADATRYADGGDPAPRAGTQIVNAMPIGKAREALQALTATDPAVVTVGSVGSGDTELELHVTVENRGRCKITGASGVAYGFTPTGKPAPTNRHGEHFAAFKVEEPIEPGKHVVASQKLRFADKATLAIAQIDATECADGTTWKRQ